MLNSAPVRFCYLCIYGRAPRWHASRVLGDSHSYEATFLRGQTEYAGATKHSTAEDAAKTAEEARAKKLLLTHLSPLNDGREEEYVKEARSAYRGETIVARELPKVTI